MCYNVIELKSVLRAVGKMLAAFLMSGGDMVGLQELAAIAMRYDTSMSRAMLRALGIAPVGHSQHRALIHRQCKGVRRLMGQRHGVRVREQTYAEERAMVRRRNAGL